MLCPFLGIKVIFGVRILGLSSVNSAGGCVESLFELSQPGQPLFSSVPCVVLCSFSDAWQLPCLGWKAHKTKVEKTVSFLCLCQAFPGRGKSTVALAQLVDIPKRGGIGASNLRAEEGGSVGWKAGSRGVEGGGSRGRNGDPKGFFAWCLNVWKVGENSCKEV